MPLGTYPEAYLITFTTYGTRLHGHAAGSVDRDHNLPGTEVLAADPTREASDRERMDQPPYSLDDTRRRLVLTAIREVCPFRGWELLTAHVRTNHVHVVVQADAPPERVMNDFKTYASRALNRAGLDTPGRHRWTRHGSTRYLWTREDIEAAYRYVAEEQGEPLALWVSGFWAEEEPSSSLSAPEPSRDREGAPQKQPAERFGVPEPSRAPGALWALAPQKQPSPSLSDAAPSDPGEASAPGASPRSLTVAARTNAPADDRQLGADSDPSRARQQAPQKEPSPRLSDAAPSEPGEASAPGESPRSLTVAARILAAIVASLLLIRPAMAAPQDPMPPPPVTGLTTAVARQANLEGRVLWMDGSANLQRLSTPEGVAAVFDKCKRANINTVVVDVKPLSGHVLYNSQVAPKLQEWKGFRYPRGYDLLLQTMLQGKQRGIRVCAAINVFCEAHKLLKSGPLYQKLEQQAIVYDVQRRVTAADGAEWTLAVGENVGPAADEIASYDARAADPKKLGPADAAVVVSGEAVSAVIDGSLTEGGSLVAPAGGYLLVGRGRGAEWLLEHVQVGQALTYTAKEVLQPILESPSEAVGAFVNPANPEARAYMLRVVREIADGYAVDGIVFDRMRYASLRTDFSPLSRELFEKWLGKPVERFPQDIYEYSAVPGRPLVRGPYFNPWLEWRAKNINDWLAEARQVALSARPSMSLGVYVGSWYDSYYEVGVNWGAEDYQAGLDWMTEGYHATGYAGKLNWLTTGCYYPVASRDDARQLGAPEWRTVQAAAETSVRAVNDAAFVYAGLYLLDYQGKPEEFRKAVEAALQYSQGVMLFDLVYLEEYDWWNILNDLFSTPRRAPHDVPGLQEAIQQTRRALRPPATASPASP